MLEPAGLDSYRALDSSIYFRLIEIHTLTIRADLLVRRRLYAVEQCNKSQQKERIEMAMNGMEMLMKASGLDPSAIKAQIEQVKNEAIEFTKNLDSRLKSIESKLDSLKLDNETDSLFIISQINLIIELITNIESMIGAEQNGTNNDN